MNKAVYFIFTLAFCLSVNTIIIGQDSTNNRSGKLSYGILIQPNLEYADEYSSGNANINLIPRINYEASKRLTFYSGVDLCYGNGWGYNNPARYGLAAFSAGGRYFFFKKKWLFAESGYQLGKYYHLNQDSAYNLLINQIGVGIGLRFQLAHHPGIGKFMFETIFRSNYYLHNSYNNTEFYVNTKNLGTSFGFHYYFDPSRPPQKAISEEDSRIKPLHIIKASGSPSIDYTFEIPLTKSLCFNNSLILNNLTYLLEDTAMLFVQLNIEPRWYYGYIKRMQRNQITTNNSSDFLSLSLLTTHPFTEVKMKNATMFTLLPKWGLRRALGKHFIFEFALGYGISQAYYDKKWFTTSQPFFNYYLGYVF